MAKFKDPLDNPEPFQIPKAILTMLEECSPQGYIFCYCDNFGSPQIKVHFPFQIAEIGLRAYLEKVLSTINELESEDITDNFIRQNFEVQDDDDSEEES